MFRKMSNFFLNIFSKKQCSFRKGCSTQHCLTAMFEKYKTTVDKGKVFTDPSFGCLDHNLVIAKLNPYGFSLPGLRINHDHLSNRKQRTKINNSYS